VEGCHLAQGEKKWLKSEKKPSAAGISEGGTKKKYEVVEPLGEGSEEGKSLKGWGEDRGVRGS